MQENWHSVSGGNTVGSTTTTLIHDIERTRFGAVVKRWTLDRALDIQLFGEGQEWNRVVYSGIGGDIKI